MGRARSWNEEEVLDAVVKIFRERGYTAVTVREIENETGLHVASLYHAYGSKEGLFSAALGWYMNTVVRRRVAEHLEREDAPLEGIRAYFVTTFASLQRDPGCLLTNTAVECYALEPGTQEAVAAGLQVVQEGFTGALTRAQQRGEIAASVMPSEVASQLLALYQGVLVLVRSGAPTDELARLVGGALDSLVPTRSRTKGVSRWLNR
jgi:TetR/AcrR family transcriptional repressor of nem operon